MEFDSNYVIRASGTITSILDLMNDKTRKVMQNAYAFRANFECVASESAYDLTLEITQIIKNIKDIIEEKTKTAQEGAFAIEKAEEFAKGIKDRV